MSIWWGVLAPAGLPSAVADKLYTEIAAILSQPDSAQRLAAEGAEPSTLPGAAFERLLTAEVDKWQRVARDANIKVDSVVSGLIEASRPESHC